MADSIGYEAAPSRYMGSIGPDGEPIETIDQVRDQLGDDFFVGLCWGTAEIYLSRAGLKVREGKSSEEAAEEDRDKAGFWLKMRDHVLRPELFEDPRVSREDFQPYVRKAIPDPMPHRLRFDLLDHGYLEEVETWGQGYARINEAAIVEAARMSTGGGFRGWRTDEKLLRTLYTNKHCYDESTEVLVRGRGFVPWAQVGEEDELGQWDSETDSLVYEKPASLIREVYSGPMYRVDHGGVDLLVTPTHKMLVKRKHRKAPGGSQVWWDDWRLVEAAELGNKTMVRYRKHAERRDAPELSPPPDCPSWEADPEAFLSLVGFFLGDGSAKGTGVTFHMTKQRKRSYLKGLCERLGWSCTDARSMSVSGGPGSSVFFLREFYSGEGEKRVPGWLFDLRSDLAAALLDGLRNSDGTEKRSTWTYSTTSRQLAEAFQVIALHAGVVVNQNKTSVRDNPQHADLYRLSVLSRMREPVVNQTSAGQERQTSVVQHEGVVYCAHTRTGVLVVRRNGKAVLSGNSTPFEFAGLTLRTRVPIAVIREWHRHRTQSYGEASARYKPLPLLFYVPSIERLMMSIEQAEGGNKQAGTVSGAQVLTREVAEHWQEKIRKTYAVFASTYEPSMHLGIPKELARMDMPVGMYTEMEATANLRNWLAFMTLRLDPGAQWEIRQYAQAVACIIQRRFPRTFGLFAEGNEHALNLSPGQVP